MKMNLREVCTASLRAFWTTDMHLLPPRDHHVSISISMSIDLTAFTECGLPRFAQIYH